MTMKMKIAIVALIFLLGMVITSVSASEVDTTLWDKGHTDALKEAYAAATWDAGNTAALKRAYAAPTWDAGNTAALKRAYTAPAWDAGNTAALKRAYTAPTWDAGHTTALKRAYTGSFLGQGACGCCQRDVCSSCRKRAGGRDADSSLTC